MSSALDAETIGPVECAVIQFDGNHFQGKIIPALQELIDSQTVRIIDLVLMKKDPDGNSTVIELSELDKEEAAPLMDLDGEIDELISENDMQIIAQTLKPNSTAALVLWEDLWASRLSQAIQNADGELVFHEYIEPEAIATVLADRSLGG